MYKALARSLRNLGFDPRGLYLWLSRVSLDAAIREQRLEALCDRLRAAVPDLADQYTHGVPPREYAAYWERKMRGLHAFQVQGVLDALDTVPGDGLVIADIGDSSGNHARYIKAVAPAGKVARVVSVNLDPVAVEKIRAKGGEVVLSRAEDLDLSAIGPDLVCLFETLEHLTDPPRFLHRLATAGAAHVLISVPYRRDSRFGGSHLRTPVHEMPERLSAEQVHVYEFSPEDWMLLARFAGYRPVFRRLYRQYPVRFPLRLTASLWRHLDFEGFVVALLTRDSAVADRYDGW